MDIMDIKDAYIFKKMIFSSVLGRRAFCNVVILSVTFLKNLSTTLLEIGMSLKSMYVVFEAVLCCFCPSNSALMPQLAYFSSSTSFLFKPHGSSATKQPAKTGTIVVYFKI